MSSKSSSKESLSCSNAINIIDDNELGVNESRVSLSHSTFLRQYENQIRNILFYYKNRKVTELWQTNQNFFQTNSKIIHFIKNNLNEMEEFINDYVDKYKMDKEQKSNLWKSFKVFISNDFNTQDIQNVIISNENNVMELDEDFNKFLMCLINENVANQNGIDYFNLEPISGDRLKRPRSIKEFARAFCIFIVDMPAHDIVFDEEHPHIKLKIYLVEINREPYDNDVLYFFSHNDCKLYCSSSNCNKVSSNEGQNELDLANPDVADIPSTESQETLNASKKNIDVHDSSLREASEIENALLESKSCELEKSKESCKLEVLSKTDDFNKYYSRIRLRFDLNNNTTFHFLKVIKIKRSSIWVMILKILLSFSSILDMILDIILACTFFQSDQIRFGILTIAILIITGAFNIFLESKFLKRVKQESNYLPSCLNNALLRYICSFFQLSTFLGNFKSSIVSIKAANEEEIKTLLKLLCGNNTARLQHISQYLKYIETYLEALPQTLLQIYIILTTNKWVWMQLVSIVSGIVNIQLTILAFEAFIKGIDITDIWKHPVIILTAISYNGFLIISHTLLFWQFHWIFGILWIGLHIFISYFSKCNEDGTLIFFKFKLKKIVYETIFNKITVFDHIIILCIFIAKLIQLKDSVFITLFVCQIIFSIIWITAIFLRKFLFFTNIMYIFHFVRDPTKQ